MRSYVETHTQSLSHRYKRPMSPFSLDQFSEMFYDLLYFRTSFTSTYITQRSSVACKSDDIFQLPMAFR